MNRLRTDTERRFWSKVDRRGEDECWLWKGAPTTRGYGVFFVDGLNVGAHRIAYTRTHGQIPNGLCICHRCDVKLCVNPAHLFTGTHAENVRDRDAKGRTAHGDTHSSRTRPECLLRGEKNGNAKLTENIVRDIRRLRATGLTQRAIAAQFGISRTSVCDVLLGHIWRHVVSEPTLSEVLALATALGVDASVIFPESPDARVAASV